MNAPDQHVEVPVPEGAYAAAAQAHYEQRYPRWTYQHQPEHVKVACREAVTPGIDAAAPFIAAKAVEEAEAQRDAAYKAEEIANRERDQAVQQERERLRELVAWLRSSGGMIDRFVVADRIAALDDQEGGGA